MPTEASKTLRNRGEYIDSIVDKAQDTLQERDIPKKDTPKNPYPPGSARAKLWARKQKEKK